MNSKISRYSERERGEMLYQLVNRDKRVELMGGDVAECMVCIWSVYVCEEHACGMWNNIYFYGF